MASENSEEENAGSSNQKSEEIQKSDKSTEQRIKIVGLAIFLRIFAAQYFSEFAHQFPLFSTPWNSLKRLKEGVFLLDSGQPIYDGDLFHVLPMFVHAIRPSLDFPLLLRLEWTFLDLFCAYFLAKFVNEYIQLRSADMAKGELEKAKWLGTLAFASYLLNPMSIGCWTVLSLSAIVNALISASLYFMIAGNLFPSILTLSMAIQLNPYYAILFAPIFIQFQKRKVLSIFLSICLFASLFATNFLLEENPKDLFRSTIGFFLNVPDLTPNNGIFWYFFTQVFEHYRLLFLCVFQLNSLIYVVPLSTLIRKNPALLASVLLITVSLFSPYPSYAETALYLPTLAAFFDLHKFLRQRLVTGCTLLATFVLSPVMWAMWVTIGSGNANFFFAIVWVFNLAQIFISADLVSSFLRAELVRENGGENEVEENFEGVRLLNISPYYTPVTIQPFSAPLPLFP